MKLAIVGATGMVGREMLKILEQKKILIEELILVASEKSVGKKLMFKNKKHSVISLSSLVKRKIDFALFSAGKEVSKQWAPKLAEKGCRVIDNSSYWRMCSKHKLIVPEINGEIIDNKDMIIANPNCSTIQLVAVLYPLHQKYKISRVIVSTYQSVSGTGKSAVEQLRNEEKGLNSKKVYPYQIYKNVLPHCDDFEENGYTKEEMKIINETKKILDEKINITATAARVPVLRGHSESVNITFENSFSIEEVKKTLENIRGIKLADNTSKNIYPTPITSENQNEVFVGRIRRDESLKNTINLWIVADNLRKGAATNTVQILQKILKKSKTNDSK